MINAHIEESSVYWAQHENRLYKFRILELSEPFCDQKATNNNGLPLFTRSCDNVAQRLQQLERGHKRPSEPFISRVEIPTKPFHPQQKRYNRTRSLPTNLHEFVNHEITIDNLKRDQSINTYGENCSRKNGLINNSNIDNEQQCENKTKDDVAKTTCSKTSSRRTEQHALKDNFVLDEVLVEEHCTSMNSNLRELSTRFGRLQLEKKTKDELISIILELQDALRLSTDD